MALSSPGLVKLSPTTFSSSSSTISFLILTVYTLLQVRNQEETSEQNELALPWKGWNTWKEKGDSSEEEKVEHLEEEGEKRAEERCMERERWKEKHRGKGESL